MSCNPPLPNDHCPEAFSTYQKWFDTCRQSHEDCRKALDGKLIDEQPGPELPTRVLDLGEPGATDLVLVETKGLRGNYCALSYCWGPPGTKTFITTNGNLGQRLSGIAFDSMPKTFQDAAQITRQLSVRYLWIDGLCIIQGDSEDWTRESKQMGSIYERACLVIAASGAESPKEGCFVSTPRELLSTELPFFSSSGQSSGSFNVCIFSYKHPMPALGPLRKRGWALQESYLARRSLNFMPAGPSWICRGNDSLTLCERNLRFGRVQFPQWDRILYEYSRMELTLKSDRLMAVEGIASVLARKTEDTYYHGVFLSDIASHLFWMSKNTAPESEQLNDVPSWSWASAGVSKAFWTTQLSNIEANINQGKVQIDGHGCLRLQGYVIECNTDSVALNAHSELVLDDLRTRILFIASAITTSQKLFYMPQCNGIAVFDSQHFSCFNCLCLMSTTLRTLFDYIR